MYAEITKLELNLRCTFYFGTLVVGNFKHWLFLEAEHLGKNHRREGLHGIVKLARCRIKEATNGSQLVLQVGQFLLQMQEVFVGFKFRISL